MGHPNDGEAIPKFIPNEGSLVEHCSETDGVEEALTFCLSYARVQHLIPRQFTRILLSRRRGSLSCHHSWLIREQCLYCIR